MTKKDVFNATDSPI